MSTSDDSDDKARASLKRLIDLQISRSLHILQALMGEGERIREDGLMARFVRCVEFELVITSWRIAGYVTAWGWRGLSLPAGFIRLIQATAQGLLDDDLVIEALAGDLAKSLPPISSDPPRAWWINFPARESEAPKSQDDMEDLERLYPSEVLAENYRHVLPPPPIAADCIRPGEIGMSGLLEAKLEAERLLSENTQLTVLFNAVGAGTTPPCPALLSASTGWVPLAEEIRDHIVSADSLLFSVFRNGIPDGYLDFQVGYRWWEHRPHTMTASERYHLTFSAWWNEQPNSLTRGAIRMKSTSELRSALYTLMEERGWVDEDTAKALARVVGLRIQLKQLK
ncbi:hypothetical protein CC1G_10452 [Coprinopsis cinerea okayama7|uniref:Uncharacterized protein n=1 Tax=Coprinopsis cinerea (strain Okayama-7 / 130 / ATCC MYA-4618 / FGSC 9003) TaxID=240176 RepID=A8PDU0_COPC7|nr:hypothetical protein CC1G_10452 [Coprinopsis cinerea okayama7\|eukprot:XP_001840666.2 hypothetical protein CC1G_10452 [Coprinopsis cinerea okayama7\